MTRMPGHAAPSAPENEVTLRRMIGLADDIIAEIRPLDGVSTLAMLLVRHEFARHLARIGDDSRTVELAQRAEK